MLEEGINLNQTLEKQKMWTSLHHGGHFKSPLSCINYEITKLFLKQITKTHWTFQHLNYEIKSKYQNKGGAYMPLIDPWDF